MRASSSLVSAFLLIAAGAAEAASSWGFDQGSLAVTSKKGPDGAKEK
jgi:oligosaccharyltransferase complex subunit delta (ribophorin II)